MIAKLRSKPADYRLKKSLYLIFVRMFPSDLGFETQGALLKKIIFRCAQYSVSKYL